MRLKRILRNYGYPPDLQDAAVLAQAEVSSAKWVGRNSMNRDTKFR